MVFMLDIDIAWLASWSSSVWAALREHRTAWINIRLPSKFFLFKNLVFTYFEEKAVLWIALFDKKTICILLTTIYGLHIFLFIQVLNVVIAYDFWKWKIKGNFKIKTKGIEQTYVSGLYTMLNDGKQNQWVKNLCSIRSGNGSMPFKRDQITEKFNSET